MAVIKLVFKPDVSEVSQAFDTIKQKISNGLGNIKITVDSGAAQATQNLAANLQKAAQNAGNLSGDFAKLTTVYSGLERAEDKITRKITETNEALGTRVRVIETIKDEEHSYTTEVIQDNEKIKKAQEELNKAYVQGFTQREKEVQKKQQETWNQFLKDERQYQDQRQKIEDQKAAQAQAANRQSVLDEEETLRQRSAAWKAYFDNLNQQIEANQKADKARQRAAETSVTLEKQYSDLIRQIQTLKAQYPEGTFDAIEQQAREARDELRNLDRTTENYAEDVNRLAKTHQSLKRDIANTRTETDKLDKVTESLWMNIQKFARWYVIGNVFTKILNSFREALSTMKEVDTELANIQKVTDRTDAEMQKLAESAYKAASAYGVTANAYLESAAEFAKAGFGDRAEELAEVAIKTQLVGDVSADIADKFLLASNAAWKMDGNLQLLNRTLDAANIIENNYATSIEKLAAGMPIAASVAANAGMTFEQTIAALGTITSVTQETGTKAATALRALILNIIGAVGEYEDGIEVTEESVKSLDGILQVYAKDAMQAAKEAGTVINPMEAIAALAKASEEGLVNQAELFEILSSLGGKLRTNQLISLVQNYDMFLEMLDKTTESAGSADKEIGIMLDTWEAKTNILQNTWTEFIAKTLDSELIKTLLDVGTAVVDFADNAGVAAVAVAGLLTLFKGKEIIGSAKSAFDDLTKSLKGLSGGFTAVTTWAGLAMTAIAAGIMIYKQIDKARAETVARSAEEAKAYEESVKQSDILYGKLSDEKLGRDELNAIIAKTDEAYAEEAQKIEDINELRSEAIRLIGEEAKAEAQAYIDRNAASYLTAKSILANEGVRLKSYQASVDSYTKQYQQDGRLSWFDTKNLQFAQKRIDALSERVENAQKTVEQYETALSILDGTYESVSDTTESAANNTQNLVRLLNEAKRLGVDINKTVYGNIDTNNRQVIQWTQANLEKYKNELASWGYEIEDLFGSISTVMGTSSEFDGVEIAFSPILQTDSGPVLLSEETVNRYIFGLIEKAGEGWTNEELLGLDADGLIIDGRKIQNLLADIGDTAIQTGQAMHYVGQYGALALAGMTTHTVQVKTLTEKLQEASETATKYDAAIGGVVDAMADFGAGSIEVYNAMKSLEETIPGSTDKLYDFDTATVLAGDDIFTSKEAMLDFIDSSKQLEFTQAISELEDLAAGYWDVAGAALAAMANQQAAAQMAGVLEFTTGSIPYVASAQLADLKRQKAEWDAYIATLRGRGDYRGGSSDGGRNYTPVSSALGRSTDAELERLKAIVSWEKAELNYLQASGKSLEDINKKRKSIQDALHEQAEYMRSALALMDDTNSTEAERKAYEEAILALSTEWWSIQQNISDDLAKAEEERKKQLEEEAKLLEEQKKFHQEIFDTLRATVDDYYSKLISGKEKELSLEEKILAVQQAEAALANAQNERTVKIWNAAAEQWEWRANAKNVKSAQDALKRAQDALNEYQRQEAWETFKSAWEYVSDQIKDGAMTFREAYDYMYDAMKGIQDKYGVDLGLTLEDSIGGFKALNYGIDGLTQEVADSLGASVGILRERLEEYEDAVGYFRSSFDEATDKLKNGEMSIEDAYSYLRDRAREIADRYGIDMTGALDEAIAGMDKTSVSIDELWKAVIIQLMKVNSARWFDAGTEERALLHAQNEFLGGLIGATYDPNGYWSLNGSRLYESQRGASYSSAGTSAATTSGASTSADPPASVPTASAPANTGAYPSAGANPTHQIALAQATTAKDIDALRKMEEAYARGDHNTVTAIENQLRSNGKLISTTENGKPSGMLYSVSGHSNGVAVKVLNGQNASGVDPGTILVDSSGQYWRIADNGVDVVKDTAKNRTSWYEQYQQSGRLDTYDSGGILKGVGGIKATARDELILGPELTEKAVSLSGDVNAMRTLDILGGLLDVAAKSLPFAQSTVGSQYNGAVYQLGSVTLTEGQARSTSVYDLAQMASGLGIFNNRI